VSKPAAAADPGELILATAALRVSARGLEAADQAIPNLGTLTDLDGIRGSTSGVDTNDPLLLEHDGTNYVWLPGTNNNRLWIRSPKVAAKAVLTKLDGTTVDVTHTFDVNSRMFIQAQAGAPGTVRSLAVLDADDVEIWRWSADGWVSGPGSDLSLLRGVASPAANLMTNPGFEDADVYTWNSAGFNAATSSAISSEQAHFGTYSRKIVLPGSTNWEGSGIANDMRGFEPGVDHTVTAWVYRESGSGPIAMTAGMESPPYTRDTVVASAPVGQWEQLAVTAPADVGGGLFIGFHNTVTGGAVTFFVDDIEIKQTGSTAHTVEVWREGVNVSTLVTAPMLQFSGDDMISFSDVSALDAVFSGDFTVLAFIERGTDYNYAWASGAYGTEDGVLLGFDTHGQGAQVTARVADGTNAIMRSWSDWTPPLGHRFMAGFTFTRAVDGMKIVHDGVLQPTGGDASGIGPIADANGAHIGYHPAGAWTKGRFCELAVFDSLLSEEDIGLVLERWVSLWA
jgi:hypothetical protein